MTTATAVQPGTVIRVTSGEKQIGDLTFNDASNKYGKTLKSGSKQIVARLGKALGQRVVLMVMGMHSKNDQFNGHFQVGDTSFRFARHEAITPKKRKAG